MLEFFQQVQWSPYFVGSLIGVLSWFTFLSVGKPLGVSTSFVRTAGMIEKRFAPDRVKDNPYFQEHKPEIDWQWMLVVGMLIGAFLSAWISGDLSINAVPRLWETRFGPSIWFRWSMAFLGGVILMLGARLAGGWTSGHGISGTLQLTLSGWVSAICFFMGGIAMGRILYL